MRERKINKRPLFYKTMGGGAYHTRLTKGIGIRDEMMISVKTIEKTGKTEAVDAWTEYLTETVHHGLGFIPYIVAGVRIWEASEDETEVSGEGVMPFQSLGGSITTTLSAITNKKFTYSVTLTPVIPLRRFKTRVKFRLYKLF